jgi:hypothetical protein
VSSVRSIWSIFARYQGAPDSAPPRWCARSRPPRTRRYLQATSPCALQGRDHRCRRKRARHSLCNRSRRPSFLSRAATRSMSSSATSYATRCIRHSKLQRAREAAAAHRPKSRESVRHCLDPASLHRPFHRLPSWYASEPSRRRASRLVDSARVGLTRFRGHRNYAAFSCCTN